MRRVVVGAFVSLDGVMQAPGGPEEDPTGGFRFGGWTAPLWDEASGRWIRDIFARPFDLLLGRKTYEIFAAYWPYQPPDGEIAGPFNAVTKYVATSSDAPLAWANSVALDGDVPTAVAALKREEGPDLVTQGSSILVQSLLAHGLVDEIGLLILPVLLGRGKRLFDDSALPGALQLVDSRTFSTGVVMARYRPAGAVRTGSFGPDKPSESEIARRARMKREG